MFMVLCVRATQAQDGTGHLQAWSNEQLADTTRLRHLHELIWSELLPKSPERAARYAAEEYAFAVRIGSQRWMAWGRRSMMACAKALGDLPSALEHNREEIQLWQVIDDELALAEAWTNLARVFETMARFDSAEIHYAAARDRYDELGQSGRKLDEMNNLANLHYYRGNIPAGLAMQQEIYMEAASSGDSLRMARALNNTGNFQLKDGRHAEAARNFAAGAAIAKDIEDTLLMAQCAGSLGNAYLAMGRPAQAVGHLIDALHYYGWIGNSLGALQIAYGMGQLYKQQDEFDSALVYFQRVDSVSRSLRMDQGLAYALPEIGNIMKRRRNYPAALERFDEAMAVQEKIGDRMGLVASLTSKAAVLNASGSAVEGLNCADQARELARELGSDMAVGWAILRRAESLEALGRVQEGSIHAAKALELASDDIELRSEATDALYRLNKALDRSGIALAYLEQVMELKDSVRNKDNQKALFKADLKYANEQRAFADSLRHAQEMAEASTLRTIESLRADRNRNRAIALGGGAALLLLAGGVFFRTDTRRRKALYERDIARSESAALRAQMNPHFNNNALQAINNYLGEDDLASARKLVTRFARVMRQVLENSSRSEVSLAEDLEVVKGFMQVEEMRTRGKFTFHLEVAPEVDLESVHVPPLVFQPFLENAIWHGIMPKNGPGSITMRVQRKGDTLTCEIEDDGVGRGSAKEQTGASGASKGSSITRSRLDLLSRLTGRSAWFEYLEVPIGTTVHITLPLK